MRLEKSDRIMRYSRYPLDLPLGPPTKENASCSKGLKHQLKNNKRAIQKSQG